MKFLWARTGSGITHFHPQNLGTWPHVTTREDGQQVCLPVGSRSRGNRFCEHIPFSVTVQHFSHWISISLFLGKGGNPKSHPIISKSRTPKGMLTPLLSIDHDQMYPCDSVSYELISLTHTHTHTPLYSGEGDRITTMKLPFTNRKHGEYSA